MSPRWNVRNAIIKCHVHAHTAKCACTATMASGLVRSALSAAIDDENVKDMDSQRVKKMIDVGNAILLLCKSAMQYDASNGEPCAVIG